MTSAKQGVAALRNEIRRAGDATSRARWVALTLTLAGAALTAFAMTLSLLSTPGADRSQPHQIVDAFSALVGCLCAPVGAAAAGPIWRRVKTARLQREIAALDRDLAARTLAALHDDSSGDTRQIAAALLRRLDAHPPTEVVPTLQPEGWGDEVAAG